MVFVGWSTPRLYNRNENKFLKELVFLLNYMYIPTIKQKSHNTRKLALTIGLVILHIPITHFKHYDGVMNLLHNYSLLMMSINGFIDRMWVQRALDIRTPDNRTLQFTHDFFWNSETLMVLNELYWPCSAGIKFICGQ